MGKGPKRFLVWTGIAFLVFYLFTQPTEAANAVNGIFDLLRQAAEAFVTFLRNVF